MLFSSKEFKLLTKIKSLGDVQKSLQQLEKKINELSESTNSTAGGEVDDAKGKSGDIKITKGKDNAYTFEIKTEDGWKTPVIGNSAITFKDKPAAISAPKVESIDEIESADSTTGDVKAKKVIFDEKADKFILARPDYDSGWNSVNRLDTTRLLTLTHDIASPTLFKWMVKDSYGDNAGNAARNVIFEPQSFVYTSYGSSHAWIGVNYYVGSETAVFESHNGEYMHHEYTAAGGHEVWNRMDVRLLLWK